MIASFTSDQLAAGFFWKKRAAIPATTGELIDVPLLRLCFLPAATFSGSSAARIFNSLWVPHESIHSPVAVMSGLILPSRVGPRLEKVESSPGCRDVSRVI